MEFQDEGFGARLNYCRLNNANDEKSFGRIKLNCVRAT